MEVTQKKHPGHVVFSETYLNRATPTPDSVTRLLKNDKTTYSLGDLKQKRQEDPHIPNITFLQFFFTIYNTTFKRDKHTLVADLI